MKLTTLKPRFGTATISRVKPLIDLPGVEPRPNGRAWTARRQRIALAHDYCCVDCGRVWRPDLDHIDHDMPLEQGGSNEDANLKPRCLECHGAKTAREAGDRAFRRCRY